MTDRRLGLVLSMVVGCSPSIETEVWSVPENLGDSIPSPEQNPLTAEGVALGEKLFFDPRLSATNEISCATCHRPELAFSDGMRRSTGVGGTPLVRHTPALQNLAWASGLFWDGGAKNLESQAFAPLTSSDEMGQDLDQLVDELNEDPDYGLAFGRAFREGLTIANVARALAQFERSLIAADSRYDRFARHEPGGELGADELLGLKAFSDHCGGCHVADFFTDYGYHNNGLDDEFSAADERIAWGRARITNDLADLGKFKTPSLRNVAVTAPYMHDGRFSTLTEVLDHYRTGVRWSQTLDPSLIMADGTPGISLSDDEAEAIISFLTTLTDDTLAPSRPATRDGA